MLKLVIAVVLFIVCANADVYMHNMRGSNNRLNGAGNNRANNNRLCDTQNNAKGGYCWGPKMDYYVGSLLPIEWTNQHGCGNSQERLECQVVLQYMCGDTEIRDGTTTGRIQDDANAFNDKNGAGEYVYGMHETYHYYQQCKGRNRNKGLFIADNNIGNAATRTRQNNNGGRSGFECPEERDYYPYWHPTPWKDIAVLTSETSRCEYYAAESQNVKDKWNCTGPDANAEAQNNKASCETEGGTWTNQGSWGIPAPDCLPAPFSRQNHLGNGVNGEANTYNWTIPNDISENCVLRLRYNITTQDRGGQNYWNLDHKYNGVTKSPVTNDPYVWHAGKELRLAINTDQFGRTFQDRSHVFSIKARPAGVSESTRIFNLNVRGKRGNIVQTYPAVEYDFVPNRLHVKKGDFVHFQWTGCDTNPNGNDGEGTRQTDRSNLVMMPESTHSYPVYDAEQFDKTGDTASYATASALLPGDEGTSTQFFKDLATAQKFTHLDQTNCLTYEELTAANPQPNLDEDVRNCAKLNAASRKFGSVAANTQQSDGLIAMEKTGSFRYMSSRNNNFSNRAQKGTLVADALLDTFGIVFVGVSSAAFAAAVVVAIIIKVAPGSGVAASAVGA